MINTVQRAFQEKLTAACAFLDIESAFGNTSHLAVQNALMTRDMPATRTVVTEVLTKKKQNQHDTGMSTRRVTLTLNVENCRRQTARRVNKSWHKLSRIY